MPKRRIVEHRLQNAVTAPQRYAEGLYSRLPALQVRRRNTFQNLTEGSCLWHKAADKRREDHLDDGGCDIAMISANAPKSRLASPNQVRITNSGPKRTS